MKYGDIIRFDPIETVIQLLDANKPSEAQRLVETFVISDAMAERMADILIPQLGFADGVDHMGLIVVGNYGTGKSHLMSVISAIAENAALVPHLRHPAVRKAAESIAGKLKVHRIEIGASQMSVRAILTSEIEAFLKSLGIEFQFPAADQVVQNKAALAQMMVEFETKYPGQGLLLVVDELLDYLRNRKDHELVHDLSFLREIGEIAKNSRFRFIAGVQEAIFDGGRFTHMADSVRRVKDRFHQVAIDREDISFVVAERLLRKDADQAVAVRKHLEKFSKFYGNMSERMDRFVAMFPVHPDYLTVFETISFAEKRNALKTLSSSIKSLIEKDVPNDEPGLITYDSFWSEIRSNPVFRADRAISDVIRVSDVLRDKIEQSYPKAKASSKPLALKLINALSIQRLTTPDVHTTLGPTSEQLRDQLALHSSLIAQLGSDEPAADLLSHVQSTLQEILRTVNGQFITRVPDNDQYFLDLKKDVDYDAQIEKRAESLDDEELDKAYYSALAQLMERADEAVYVTGHRIWQYSVEWYERRVERSGYLFFGAPNDRPTAQPDRDFYLYFIQPFDPPRFRDEDKDDEVFFRLSAKDDAFDAILKRYASARAWAQISSGGAKDIYRAKAEDTLKQMQRWLRDKQASAFEVTYRGKSKPLQAWLSGVQVRERAHLRADETINFRDMVNVIAGVCLAPRFADGYPEYPPFSSIITEQNRRLACTAAIKALAGGGRTKEAVNILDALKLLDGEKIDVAASPYASAILEKLKAKGAGQVLNRQEIFTGDANVEVFEAGRFGLEPDLLAVIIGALVHTGDVVLTLPGQKIDSTTINKLTENSIDDISNFKHIEAPKDVNVSVLREIYDLLGLPSGQAQAAAKGDEDALRTLQTALEGVVQSTLDLGTGLQSKLTIWGHPLMREEDLKEGHVSLTSIREFAEEIARYNTPGKLKSLRTTSETVGAQKKHMDAFRKLERLASAVATLSADVNYLSQADYVVPDGDAWAASAKTTRAALITAFDGELSVTEVSEWRRKLAELKANYVTHYLALHAKARLSLTDDATKADLMDDSRLKALEQLKQIPILPANDLVSFRDKLGSLIPCPGLLTSQIEATPRCPSCSYTPRSEQLAFASTTTALVSLDQQLDDMLESWTKRLRDEFDDPVARETGLSLVNGAQRKRVEAFADGGPLPDPLDAEFVTALKEALSDLQKVEVPIIQLKTALLNGGSPVTIDDMKTRFNAFITDQTKGKDESKVRIVIVEVAE